MNYRKLVKHLGMVFMITSTCLLWGIALGFSNIEISIAACMFTILYWTGNE